MYKKTIYIIIKLYVCVIMFSNVYGQTGIATHQPHQSAILELNAIAK